MELELRWFDPREVIRCPIQLRPVRTGRLEYMQLSDSVAKNGFLTSVRTRDGPRGVEVCLGAHRHQVALDLRLKLPAIHGPMTDDEVRKAQISENATRIETEPMEYAHRLYNLVEIEKTLTLDELAHELDKHPDWVKRHLSLVRLTPVIKAATATNQLPLSVAVELAKLPPKLQEHYFGLTGCVSDRELIELIRREVRNLRLGNKEARLTEKALMKQELRPTLRSLTKIREERENPALAYRILKATGAKTALEGFWTGLDFATNFDPLTLEELAAKQLRKKE